MLKVCTFVCTVAAFVWSPSLAAQDDTDGDDVALVVTKKATAEEIEKHLKHVKASLLPKVWPPKCDRDVIERRKYLKEWQAVTSEHYIVFTDGPTASCKKYAVTLEDLYRTIKKDLPFEDIDRLLVAYNLRRRRGLLPLCRANQRLLGGRSPADRWSREFDVLRDLLFVPQG